jgi:hypothetical protein
MDVPSALYIRLKRSPRTIQSTIRICPLLLEARHIFRRLVGRREACTWLHTWDTISEIFLVQRAIPLVILDRIRLRPTRHFTDRPLGTLQAAHEA